MSDDKIYWICRFACPQCGAECNVAFMGDPAAPYEWTAKHGDDLFALPTTEYIPSRYFDMDLTRWLIAKAGKFCSREVERA